jgi:hypothetical protein
MKSNNIKHVTFTIILRSFENGRVGVFYSGVRIRRGWFTCLIMAQTETMIDRKIRIQKATSLMMVCVLVKNFLG